MTYADPQHYHVKVRVYNESIDFGKGVAELLQRIEATGSLSAAYKAMGMSASKAWKILRRRRPSPSISNNINLWAVRGIFHVLPLFI